MSGGKKSSLLIVDDEQTLRRLMRECFEENFEVLEASTGLEALQLAIKQRPDCILLDIMLPELGGYIVCEVLKQMKLTQLIPIIFVTAKPEEQNRLIALETGATDYIQKPFELEELRQRVHKALEQRPSERRAAPRLRMALPVLIEREGHPAAEGNQLYTVMDDASRSGFRSHGRLELAVGDMVRVSILDTAPGDNLIYAGRARIMWVDDRYAPLLRFGAEFSEVTAGWVIRSLFSPNPSQ